jgi:hypothetical protein
MAEAGAGERGRAGREEEIAALHAALPVLLLMIMGAVSRTGRTGVILPGAR